LKLWRKQIFLPLLNLQPTNCFNIFYRTFLQVSFISER